MLLYIFFFLILNFDISTAKESKDLYLLEAKDNEGSLSRKFLNKIYEVFKPDVFVETGTFLGKTALKASEFFKVHTIELEKELFLKAKDTFKDNPNVTIHFGDSSKIMSNVISLLNNKKVVFWLDGHYSGLHDGYQTALGDCNPLLKELDSIKNSKLKNSIILIDDIRLSDEIVTHLNNPIIGGYPTLDEICQKILEINNQYRFLVFGDILLAFPQDEKVNSSIVLQACTHSRLYNDNMDSNFILDMEKVISKANGEEKTAIEVLNNTFGSDLHAIKYNVARHYILWYALIKINEKKYKEAYDRLKHIESLGFKNWRIHWYMAQAAYGMKKIKRGNWHTAQVTYELKKQNIDNEIIKKLTKQLPKNVLTRSISDDYLDTLKSECL